MSETLSLPTCGSIKAIDHFGAIFRLLCRCGAPVASDDAPNTRTLLRILKSHNYGQSTIDKAEEWGLIVRWQKPGYTGPGNEVFNSLTPKGQEFLNRYLDLISFVQEDCKAVE